MATYVGIVFLVINIVNKTIVLGRDHVPGIQEMFSFWKKKD